MYECLINGGNEASGMASGRGGIGDGIGGSNGGRGGIGGGIGGEAASGAWRHRGRGGIGGGIGGEAASGASAAMATRGRGGIRGRIGARGGIGGEAASGTASGQGGIGGGIGGEAASGARRHRRGAAAAFFSPAHRQWRGCEGGVGRAQSGADCAQTGAPSCRAPCSSWSLREPGPSACRTRRHRRPAWP